MLTHLLDLVVHYVEFSKSLNEIQTPVSVTLGCDGVPEQLTLPMQPPSARVTWDSPARLVLSLPALNGTHLRVALKAVGCAGHEISIARSQIRLAALGVGRSRRVYFPLMSVSNFTQVAAVVTITARLAALPDGCRPNRNLGWPPFADQPLRVESDDGTIRSFRYS
jgi:hypothetical protein